MDNKKRPQKRNEILKLIASGFQYEDIISKYETPSKRGFVYETISIICLVSKELIENYNKISDTKSLKKI